jgi:hypothetical protein
MYNTCNIETDVFNALQFTSLFYKFAYVFMFIHTDNLQEFRVVFLKVILVARVGFIQAFVEFGVYFKTEEWFHEHMPFLHVFP